MDYVEISLKDANKQLKALGLKPFPMDALTINPKNDEHLRVSVEQITDHFQKWCSAQMSNNSDKSGRT